MTRSSTRLKVQREAMAKAAKAAKRKDKTQNNQTNQGR